MASALTPWRTTLVATTGIAIANLVVLAAGQVAGADMEVAQTASAATTHVGAGTVLLMSVAPALLGGLLLWGAARRGVRAWQAVGWLGLALGVLTVPMPVTVHASTATTVTLAGMHLVAGVLWLVAVRSFAHRHHAAAARVLDAA